MATFRLHEPGRSKLRGSDAFWVNALTPERARAIVASAFEAEFAGESRWLDADRTTCLQDRGQVVPSGVIALGSVILAE